MKLSDLPSKISELYVFIFYINIMSNNCNNLDVISFLSSQPYFHIMYWLRVKAIGTECLDSSMNPYTFLAFQP